MMYGPTGSGKSRTMFGCCKQPGIVYRSLKDILGDVGEDDCAGCMAGAFVQEDSGNGVYVTGMDPGFLDVLEKHPENSDRVKNMVSDLKRGPIAPTFLGSLEGLLCSLNCSLSTLQFKCIVLSAEYINELVEADREGDKMLCAGTFFNPGSWDASLLAAGTTLSAMKHVLDGHGKIVYALVRPPGHHAQPTRADGFCFLNNAGLAVHWL
ncbi:hypothetical protein GBA52_008749 [Prunus armeniaca]|nr:hypothetical protein GBA52_008749 [Prunus armeniaca]